MRGLPNHHLRRLRDHANGVDLGGYPLINYLLIPGKAKFLKEFFEVKLLVNNLAPSSFTFENGSATITVPSGLSLAPTASPQSLTQAVPPIAGGGSQAVTWVVRGDAEGKYDLSATYAGTLEPLGRSVSTTASQDRR